MQAARHLQRAEPAPWADTKVMRRDKTIEEIIVSQQIVLRPVDGFERINCVLPPVALGFLLAHLDRATMNLELRIGDIRGGVVDLGTQTIRAAVKRLVVNRHEFIEVIFHFTPLLSLSTQDFPKRRST